MPTLEVNPQKKYKMPNYVSIVPVDHQYLAIARETGNWVLLANSRQLEIFKFLSANHCISELLDEFPSDAANDIIRVLTELEAKRYESSEIKRPQKQGMYIYLTNRCNQRCRHCYMYAGEQLEEELSTSEIQGLLQKFAQQDGEVVTFTGGEATVRPDFVDIVCFSKKVGLKVCVLSNGLLWTDALIDAVKTSIDEVQISIDGFDRDSYQLVRSMDSFDLVLSAVDRLVGAGIRTIVAVSPLLDTLLEHETQYIAFVKSLISKYKEKPFYVKFNTELMDGRTIAPTEEENRQYRIAAKRIKNNCVPFSEEEGFAIDHVGNTVFDNCGYGGLTIASNGDVFFCNIMAKCAKQANIRIDSFESIMERSRKAMALSDINNLVPCNKCPLKYLCGGGCRIKYFQELVKTFVDDETGCGPFERDVPCTQEQKDKFYQLMVRANPLFYR